MNTYQNGYKTFNVIWKNWISTVYKFVLYIKYKRYKGNTKTNPIRKLGFENYSVIIIFLYTKVYKNQILNASPT